MSRFITPGTLLIIVVPLLVIIPIYSNIYLFVAFSLPALALFYNARKIVYAAMGIILVCAVIYVISVPADNVPVTYEPTLKTLFRPRFTLSDYSGDDIEIAEYIKHNTPEGAIFLTPPLFGKLRIFGERAIVVDFKAFPFEEQAMREWKQRLVDCYGTTEKTGFSAAEAFEQRYKTITDSRIRYIKDTYNISYAILYNQTDTRFPVVYRNDTYKLVHVNNM